MHHISAGNAALCLVTVVAAGDGRRSTPSSVAGARDPPQPSNEKTGDASTGHFASVEEILAAFYSADAGEQRKPRDWEAFRALFLPGARIIAAGTAARGNPEAFLTVAEHIDQTGRMFERGGYFDRELSRRVDRFGDIAQAWSTFETRRIGDRAGPGLSRGINCFQFLRREGRWSIVTVVWEMERADNPISPEYTTRPPP